ncbi:MAG: ribonuclease III [Chloroflexi bacterium OLB14]|nr:MAG: ribonuclease III [Chloroflexi bacterium OLB14]
MTPNSKHKRDIETASSLDVRLALSFSNLSLLTRALTHRSYVNENPSSTEDNERLEFLGDAVLDFVVGEWAYHRFPEMPEGHLTKIRSYLVRNERLAEFARKLNLGSALRLGRGETSSGGSSRESLLGSMFEALIGAIYLDAGLDKVRKFVIPLFEAIENRMLDEVEDPKSELQETSQALKLGTPSYRVISKNGPDHARVYEVEAVISGEVYGQGAGTSISLAERGAAKEALKKFKNSNQLSVSSGQ